MMDAKKLLVVLVSMLV